jgi:hypothetical protein
VISFHCLRSRAVSPAGGAGRAIALILTGVTPIAAAETRPRLRMGMPPSVGRFLGSIYMPDEKEILEHRIFM